MEGSFVGSDEVFNWSGDGLANSEEVLLGLRRGCGAGTSHKYVFSKTDFSFSTTSLILGLVLGYFLRHCIAILANFIAGFRGYLSSWGSTTCQKLLELVT